MSAFHNDAIPAVGERTAPFAPSSTTRRIGVAPPPNRERAFAKAKRRSWRVRLLRLAILIGGLGTVATVLVVAFFNPFSTRVGSLGFTALSVEGTKIVMDRPKLAGFRGDGQAYLLTAERALQDIKQPTVAQLQTVDGEMGMAGGEATHLSADAGVYDNLAEHMELSGNVRIKNGRFTILLRTARFDFKSGVYGSDDRVEVQESDGTTIFADRASAINHGQELTFEGHVRTNIVPQANQEPSSEVKGTNP
jgi:lipopolysaccharide export system protein LptC